MLARIAGTVAVVSALALACAQDAVLPEPRLARPGAGAENVPQPIRFQWSEVKGATAYTIQISNADSFARPLIVEESVTEPWFSREVLPSMELWWRVRAMGADGTPGTWSDARKFEPGPPAPAVAVFGVMLTPAALEGGYTADGLITLAEAAPGRGSSVRLWSSDPGAAAVPQRVTVPPGARSATFRVDTHAVGEEREIRITAASLGVTRTASLRVTPPAPQGLLLSFTINPATLIGGAQAQGTLMLSSAAPPPNGAAVTLSSEDGGAASVPGKVTIPAGQRMASFPVQTGRTGIAKSVAITAALDGATKRAAVTLEGSATATPLAAPEPQRPTARQVISNSDSVLFRWSSVPGAASYTIEVDGTGSFADTVFVNRTLPDLEARIAPFERRVFWWRVRANDEKGAPGEWSKPQVFQVE